MGKIEKPNIPVEQDSQIEKSTNITKVTKEEIIKVQETPEFVWLNNHFLQKLGNENITEKDRELYTDIIIRIINDIRLGLETKDFNIRLNELDKIFKNKFLLNSVKLWDTIELAYADLQKQIDNLITNKRTELNILTEINRIATAEKVQKEIDNLISKKRHIEKKLSQIEK